MATIPDTHRDLFEGKNFAHIATVMPDGSPQVTPVWVELEGPETVLFNTAEGRQKTKNLDRDGRIALSVADAANGYRYIQVRGTVVAKETGQAADDHIDRLAKKYLGVDSYPGRSTTGPRVLYRVAVERVQTMG